MILLKLAGWFLLFFVLVSGFIEAAQADHMWPAIGIAVVFLWIFGPAYARMKKRWFNRGYAMKWNPTEADLKGAEKAEKWVTGAEVAKTIGEFLK
jgi:hypothetical protein